MSIARTGEEWFNKVAKFFQKLHTHLTDCQLDNLGHHTSWSTLLQVMACCLISTRPLPEPMLPSCKWDHQTQTSLKCQTKYENFSFKKISLKWCLQNCGHLVQASMCQFTKSSFTCIIQICTDGKNFQVLKRWFENMIYFTSNCIDLKVMIWWDYFFMYELIVTQVHESHTNE